VSEVERLRAELQRHERIIAEAHENFARGKCLTADELRTLGVALARVDELRAQIAALEWRERTQGHA